MSKIDFIKKLETICGDIELSIEDACKITNDFIITDKVNVGIEKVNRNILIDLISEIFDNTDKVIDFANKIYNQYEDNICTIYFGYSNGSKELYFELKINPTESSEIISYDEDNDIISNYTFTFDISDKAKELATDIFNKTGLIIPSIDTYFKCGFNKNNTMYLYVFEPLIGLSSMLKTYCKDMNFNITDLENWLDEHSSDVLTFIGYRKEDDKIFLNIYTKQQ